MSTAIVTAWHQYTPFGEEFYKPMFDFYVKNIEKYRDEFDKLYFINSSWNIPKGNWEIIEKKREGHHWVQFKDAIPQIDADKILFLDDDAIIYREGVIDNWFKQLDTHDACVEFDGAGGLKHVAWEKFPAMKEKGAEKIGSWYFSITKKMLEKIGDLDMEPHYYEDGEYIPSLDYHTKKGDWTDSFGVFLWQLLQNNAKLYEIEPDRSRIYFDGTRTQEKGKDLGFYHVFSGSAPAYLLSTKKYGDKETYWKYIKEQPKSEYLRQCAWYFYMITKINYDLWDKKDFTDKDREEFIKNGDIWAKDLMDMIVSDVGMDYKDFRFYCIEMQKYHGLR